MTAQSTHLKQLANMSLCRGLDERQVTEIFDICDALELSPGQTLFQEGDDGDSLYALLEGEVEIQKSDGNGGALTLAHLTEGAVLGEMSLFGPHASRSAGARVVGKRMAVLLKVSVEKFESLLRSDNTAALKVVHNLAQVMSRRLVLMNEKLVEAGRGRRKEELLSFQKILNDWSF